MIVLVRGTNDSGNYADRITLAMASTAMQRFAKKVLCLQLTSRYRMEKVLMGKRLENSRLERSEFFLDDAGLDALLRRAEAGQLSGEQFSDCCLSVAKQTNSFDIAETTRSANAEEFCIENFGLIRELIKNANIVYDVVFLLADASKTDLLVKLEEICDREVVCIPQGPKKDFCAKDGAYFVIKNYDRLSTFTAKTMSRMYGTKLMFPFPYNIAFKDACLNEFALSFLSMNIAPDETDENFYFAESVKNLTGNVLGLEEPIIKDLNFVYRVSRIPQKKARQKTKIGDVREDQDYKGACNNLIKCVCSYLSKQGKYAIPDWVHFLETNSAETIKKLLTEYTEQTGEKDISSLLDVSADVWSRIVEITLLQLKKLEEEQNGH